MKTKTVFFLVIIAAALLLLSGNTVFAQEDAENAIYIGEDGANVPTLASNTDVTIHGSMWHQQDKSKFASFKAYGWGTYAKLKAAGSQWVHISVPIMTYLSGVAQKIEYVEFCAKSTAGATTKPDWMDLWAGTSRFLTEAVTWPADNSYHCVGHTFSPAVWYQDLGISVRLTFADPSETITLFKAWARLVP